jgi:hypothetical protein
MPQANSIRKSLKRARLNRSSIRTLTIYYAEFIRPNGSRTGYTILADHVGKTFFRAQPKYEACRTGYRQII